MHTLFSFFDTHEKVFRHVGLVLRLLIGVMLISSGAIKALDNRSLMVVALGTYGFPPAIYQLLTLMGPLEIVTGVALVLGFAPRLNTWIVLAMFAVFSGGLVFALHKGGVKDCGCFGTYVPMSPMFALARNLVLMAGAGVLCVIHRKDEIRWKTWQVATLMLATSVCGVASGWSTHAPLVDQQITKFGKTFPTWGFTHDKVDFSKGDFLLVFFYPDCPHCWTAAASIKGLVASGERVIGIVPEGYGQAAIDDYRKKMDVSFPVMRVTGAFFEKSTIGSPTFVVVRDGKNVFKAEGMVPCARTYRETIREVEFKSGEVMR
jgi:uncharacterized membrane protein YphA (DoxX/SURF4 family)